MFVPRVAACKRDSLGHGTGMIDWLQSGEVLLGLGVLLYTAFAMTATRNAARRQRYMLLKQLNDDMEYFIALALALAARARQVEQLYATQLAQPGHPDPAHDDDSLPESAERISAWLVARARQLAGQEIGRNLHTVAGTLTRSQADALFALLEARRVYVEVLATRATDLAAFPRRPGVLKRFVGAADLNVGGLRELLDEFADSLELSSPGRFEVDV
jgi:hypothetical protein